MNNEHFENLINNEERFIELSDAFDLLYDELHLNVNLNINQRKHLAKCLIDLWIELVTPYEIKD